MLPLSSCCEYDHMSPQGAAALHSFGCIPQKETAGSYGDSTFNFLRNLHSFSQQLYHFIFPPTVHAGSNVPTSLQALVIFWFVCLLIMAILTDVRYHLTVSLTCISLMISAVEHVRKGYWSI